VSRFIPATRLFRDLFWRLAYCRDASVYRLVPKIIVRVRTLEEVTGLLTSANRHMIPVTFRAAGTSLSGQSVTDSVLVVLAGAWDNYTIHEDGNKISLGPGVIGSYANDYLRPFSRKIGPDPASIDSCMIGGIAANNASGMCCGTGQNSYKTVENMKIVFSDGTILDTGDPNSRVLFKERHAELIGEIEAIGREINGDVLLSQRIQEKYRIKNTMGYSLNAFADYSDPIDIICHLMIGSEGTLGFISEITYRTVVDHAYKASALIIFPDIGTACTAVSMLKKEPVSAVELMDRASLRSVENKEGMPDYLKSIGDDAAGLLVETRAEDSVSLANQIKRIQKALESIITDRPGVFTDDIPENDALWNVRKGLFPAVGGARKIGTAVIIEDVVFPIEKLAEATVELRSLMSEYGYQEGIIFGHALEGNLHFVFTQDFNSSEEIARYRAFIEKVGDMVVKKYDGSLKGEHGTGRNMAPFVELEWGGVAYKLMKRIKKVFDPENILNPGIILSDNPDVHLEDLKPIPQVNDIVDKCMECGYCESRCPSRNLTMTPRQRIAIQREITLLKAVPVNAKMTQKLELLNVNYRYLGEQTCATDSLCSMSCPLSINVGDLTKNLRSLNKSKVNYIIAQWVADYFFIVTQAFRIGLKSINLVHSLLGTSLMNKITSGLRALTLKKLPKWNPSMPKGVSGNAFSDIVKGKNLKVVYFPSCVVRTMGPAKSDGDQRQVFKAMLSILDKSGYDVLFPEEMGKLCCGMPFESKGFSEQADQKSSELEKEIIKRSEGGKYPVLCDTGTCLYRMKRSFKSDIRLYDPVDFIHTFLLDRMKFNKIDETVALHVPCSARLMKLDEKFRALADACVEKTIVPLHVGCCGFAGDRGFFFPELNESALAELKPSLPAECHSGYSNNRTCEIGLSHHGGIPYQSIAYLVDRCTEKLI
jgi:D-lactate dehydrogenase